MFLKLALQNFNLSNYLLIYTTKRVWEHLNQKHHNLALYRFQLCDLQRRRRLDHDKIEILLIIDLSKFINCTKVSFIEFKR